MTRRFFAKLPPLRLYVAALGLAGVACAGVASESTPPSHHPERSSYLAPRAAVAPRVDGVADEVVWQRARWQELKYLWLGDTHDPQDFSGRYKVVWHDSRIYILFRFVDDVLYDAHRDPLVRYWDDDALEVFVDEDFSGGEHQFNHNAFAYHVALDNQSIDVGTDERPRNYSQHVSSRWRHDGSEIVWELGLTLYPSSYVDDAPDNVAASLHAGKIVGLMVAYCDNDGSEWRENFIGSEFVPGDDKNRGWIDAGLFGRLELGD